MVYITSFGGFLLDFCQPRGQSLYIYICSESLIDWRFCTFHVIRACCRTPPPQKQGLHATNAQGERKIRNKI
jgi:hypothetical protein